MGTCGRSCRLELFLPIANGKQTGTVGASKKEVRESVLIHVARSHATPTTFNIKTHILRNIAKRPVPLVAKEVRRLTVIDDQQVHVTPVVKVRWHDGDRMSHHIQLGRSRHICKLAVPIIAQQQIRRSCEIVREDT